MPIVVTKSEWARINKWAADKEDPEAARRREYLKYLNETSAAMTRAWPNSLENVNKRNEELRQARITAAEQANANFYKKYVKRKKQEQERLMHSARDSIFKNKDAPKMLLEAVIETVVQKEREEQVKFNIERRKEKAEQRRKDDEDIIQKAKEWHELQALKKQRRFEVNKQHQKEILDQAHEISERNRKEYEEELHLQKLDNIKADQQMEAIKTFEENFKASEKARIWSDMEQARREVEARRRERAARAQLDDELLAVLLNSRAAIESRRKRTEENFRAEKLRVLDAISQKLESGEAARDAMEQASLNKAIQERDAALEARRQAQLRKQQQFRADRIAAREQYLRDEQQRLHDMQTMRQWDIMNRFKNVELFEDFKEQQREEKRRKTQEHRAELLRLWKEREEREAQERAETRHFYGPAALSKLRAADNKLLAHAHALILEAQQHGRPTFALQRAVDRYCKMHRLYPMPPLPASQQEHFGSYGPQDFSQGDPPLADGNDCTDYKRDGLQQPQATPSKSDKHKELIVTSGSKLGRNGLQSTYAEHDIKLPPITVVPCKNPKCDCELKTQT